MSGQCALSAPLPGARLDPLLPEHVELLGTAAEELQTALAQVPSRPRPGCALFADWFSFPPARQIFRGYARRQQLGEIEARALPILIRLRAAGTVLWWLGRAVSDDPRVVPSRIANLRETAVWLDRHGERLVALAPRG